MKRIDYRVAKKLKIRLETVAPLVDLMVFGSRARGTADSYSDMDVFIELEYIDRQLKEKIHDITWEIGFENFLVISPIIFTRAEIEDSALRSSSLVRTIQAEGIKI